MDHCVVVVLWMCISLCTHTYLHVPLVQTPACKHHAPIFGKKCSVVLPNRNWMCGSPRWKLSVVYFKLITSSTHCLCHCQCTFVAVTGRNRTLLRCVFRSHYCIWSTITQNFCYGWSSYIMCCVNSWILDTFIQCIWAPPLTELCYGTLNGINVIKIWHKIMFNFYLGLPHCWLHQSSISLQTIILCR